MTNPKPGDIVTWRGNMSGADYAAIVLSPAPELGRQHFTCRILWGHDVRLPYNVVLHLKPRFHKITGHIDPADFNPQWLK